MAQLRNLVRRKQWHTNVKNGAQWTPLALSASAF
jgi:hypothetical protein